MKKLSILIAAYNVGGFIDRCLASIVKQVDESLEIVVINDGSTDNTLEIIKKYKEADDRIIIVDKPNGGVIEARKSGYKEATGDYIWFVDGDDWIEEGCIKKIYEYIKNNEYDMVCFDAYLAYDDKPKEKLHPNRQEELYEGEEYLAELLVGKASGSVWSKVIKKRFLVENKVEFAKKISYAEDVALMTSIAISEPKVLVLNDIFYYYYQREGSIINSSTKKILELKDFSDFSKRMIKKGNFEKKYKDELDYFLYLHTFQGIIPKIFTKGSVYGKQSFDIWKGLNINIAKNKYFKADERKSLKIFVLAATNNFKLGQFLFKFKN